MKPLYKALLIIESIIDEVPSEFETAHELLNELYYTIQKEEDKTN